MPWVYWLSRRVRRKIIWLEIMAYSVVDLEGTKILLSPRGARFSGSHLNLKAWRSGKCLAPPPNPARYVKNDHLSQSTHGYGRGGIKQKERTDFCWRNWNEVATTAKNRPRPLFATYAELWRKNVGVSRSEWTVDVYRLTSTGLLLRLVPRVFLSSGASER